MRLLTKEDVEAVDRGMCGEREFPDAFAEKLEEVLLARLAAWIRPQRNNVPATGEEFAAAIEHFFLEHGGDKGGDEMIRKQLGALLPSCEVVDRGFRFDATAQQHIPRLVVEFEPAGIGSPYNAKGWVDRDALAALLSKTAEKSS